MNKKNQAAKKIYLKYVQLRGYRTILDTQIDLDPELNLIIGKNGVGKSNFLNYLKTSMDFNIQSVSNHDAYLVIARGNSHEYSFDLKSKIESTIENGTPVIESNLITIDVGIDKKEQHRFKGHDELYALLNKEDVFFSTVFITHGLPVNYPLVKTPFSFRIDHTGALEGYSDLLSTSRRQSLFLENIFNFILYQGINIYRESKTPTKKEIETIIPGIAGLLEPVELSLKKFSNIEGVRLSKNYNLVFDKTQPGFSVNNLYLEFKVGRQWLPFSHLSDGERRLFYIFSEIASPTLFYFTKSKFTLNTGETNKIVLIEEPELGLHPHQLDSLLNFLREASIARQIIITTHAPQILDMLNRDELSKIIIARLTGNGTKLRHLTRKEQEKASLYLEEEAYLSDYWKYSDLET